MAIVYTLMLIIALSCSAALLGLLVYEILSIIKNISACWWPKAKAHILSAKIQEDSDGNGTYQPIITYSYTIDQETYQSSRYAFGMVSLGNKKLSEKIFSKFKDIKEVTISYQPNNPACSVLESGITMFNITALIWAVIFCILTAPLHFLWIHAYKILFYGDL